MNSQCKKILNKLENEGKIKISSFEFPKKQELKVRLKDVLEDKVEEKYYLSDIQVKRIENSTFATNHRRIQGKEWCDTLCARDWKDPKCVQVGELDIKGHDCIKRVYSGEGLSPTLTDMQGGNRQPKVVEPKIIDTNFSRNREYNKYSPTIDTYANKLKVVVDSSVKPSVAKNFEREKEEIMNSDKEIYQCECESGYQDNKVGLKVSPTIRESSSATYGMDSEYRIRKLTPRETWRLMGFTDAEFEKAAKVNSNTQLYKQAGNSIVVNVLEGILRNLLLGGKI